MSLKSQLYSIKRQIEKEKSVEIKLPTTFAFKEHDVVDFNSALSILDWTLSNIPVKINLTTCLAANYQAISLLVLYSWKLKDQGCRVSFIESSEDNGASVLWKMMGARGTFPVLLSPTQQFKGNALKPLFALRNNNDFKLVIEAAESYTEGFNVEYASTLRYVLSELLYNALEHGTAFGGDQIRNRQIPAIAQFTWYKKTNEIHFIIADVGIGIKKHIEQAYPGQENDIEAIKLSLRPQKSGTFGKNNPYTQKNNAGMGLYISSNIIRRLSADMYVVSEHGVVHVSPRDITARTLDHKWPGTFVLEPISKLSQKYSHNTEMHKTKIVLKFVFVTHQYSPEVLEPGKHAFNFPSARISP